MNVTREMLGKAHDILLKNGLMLSGSMIEEIYEAMEFQRQKDDYFDGDTQNVLLAKIAKLEAELDEWRHGERTYPPAKQSYNDMLEYMRNDVMAITVQREELKEQIAELKDESQSFAQTMLDHADEIDRMKEEILNRSLTNRNLTSLITKRDEKIAKLEAQNAELTEELAEYRHAMLLTGFTTEDRDETIRRLNLCITKIEAELKDWSEMG